MVEHDIRAHDPVEQDVRADLAGIYIFGDDRAFHAVFCSYSGCEPAVVGLRAADGEEHGGALRFGVRQQVLELSQLVAAYAEPGHIFTLNIKMNAQIFRNACEVLERCGRRYDVDLGNCIHNRSSLYIE